jgi:CheY-like chemotaxis protein
MAEDQFVILCVDDEPAVLRPLEIMLQRRGFRVVVANDGASAIELSRHIKFHAVVLDYSMPGMSGGEVARVLREENPSIPIILHTGYKETQDPLLANVTCTLPKGSLSFLVTKLNDVLHLPEGERVKDEVLADAELPAESHVA